jgi:hypothetical protein
MERRDDLKEEMEADEVEAERIAVGASGLPAPKPHPDEAEDRVDDAERSEPPDLARPKSLTKQNAPIVPNEKVLKERVLDAARRESDSILDGGNFHVRIDLSPSVAV